MNRAPDAQSDSTSATISLKLLLAVPESFAAWQSLAKKLNEAYGANLSSPSRAGPRSYFFSGQLPKLSLPLLLEDAERGMLDAMVAELGVRFVQEIREGERCLYNQVPPIVWESQPSYEDVTTAELKALLLQHRIQVLCLTTTETERKALHLRMVPLPGRKGLVEGAIHHVTYRLGRLGRYPVAHVESTTGSQARHGAALTIHDAINELEPKAVVAVGIAFGLDPVKQRLGDVIVAESVIPYELQRVGMKAIHRGQSIPCGSLLSERFRTRRADWRLERGEDSVAVFQGAMLSGEKLVDNLEFRERLLEAFPHALAGEMEGAGLYAATARQGVEVLLVKALCDWGDGSKTDRAQSFAAKAAVSLVEHVLSKREALAPLIANEEESTPREESQPLKPVTHAPGGPRPGRRTPRGRVEELRGQEGKPPLQSTPVSQPKAQTTPTSVALPLKPHRLFIEQAERKVQLRLIRGDAEPVVQGTTPTDLEKELWLTLKYAVEKSSQSGPWLFSHLVKFFETYLPSQVIDALSVHEPSVQPPLVLHPASDLARVPWELLPLHNEPICLTRKVIRASIGIATQARGAPQVRVFPHVLIIEGQGRGSTRSEIDGLARIYNGTPGVFCKILLNATFDQIMAELDESLPDLIHYSGNLHHEEGELRLKLVDNKRFSTGALRSVLSKGNLPFLVVDAPSSAFAPYGLGVTQTEEGFYEDLPLPDKAASIFEGREGLMDLATQAGVGAFVGSFAGGRTLVPTFMPLLHRGLLSGLPIADAVLHARQGLQKKFPHSTAALQYVLSGDGNLQLVRPQRK